MLYRQNVILARKQVLWLDPYLLAHILRVEELRGIDIENASFNKKLYYVYCVPLMKTKFLTIYHG